MICVVLFQSLTMSDSKTSYFLQEKEMEKKVETELPKVCKAGKYSP